MKTSMVVLFVLVSLSLVLSLISVVILYENNFGFRGNQNTPTPTSTPTITNTPTTTPFATSTPRATANPNTVLDVNYTETCRQIVGNDTTVTLTVNATYISGSDIQLSYSQFYLGLYAPRFIAQIPAGTTYPLNNGTFAVGISHQTQIFQLNFEFGSSSFNGMDNVGTFYNLEFSGTAVINWG